MGANLKNRTLCSHNTKVASYRKTTKKQNSWRITLLLLHEGKCQANIAPPYCSCYPHAITRHHPKTRAFSSWATPVQENPYWELTRWVRPAGAHFFPSRSESLKIHFCQKVLKFFKLRNPSAGGDIQWTSAQSSMPAQGRSVKRGK